MTRMKKELFAELEASMKQALAHSQGKITLRSRQVPVPKKVTALAPKEIRKLRERLGTSQAVFARLLNVSTTTEIKWETGRRKPSGAALRLLDIAKRRPEILFVD
jgi:putative transcriptional regulator